MPAVIIRYQAWVSMYHWYEQISFLLLWISLIFFLHLTLWQILKHRIPCYAYPLSYPLALLFLGLISWWLVMLHLPAWGAVLPFLMAAGYSAGKGDHLFPEVRASLKWDLLFFSFFLAMLLVRVRNPAIIGNERFLDMGVIASIMRNPIVPPLDPQFAGGSLDIYYYFSHWIYATLGLSLQVPPAVVYTLVLPTTVGLSAVALYAIGELLLPRFHALLLLLLVIPRPSLLLVLAAGRYQDFTNALEQSVQVIPGVGSNYPWYDLLWGIPHPHLNALAFQLLFLFLSILLLCRWDALGIGGRRWVMVLTGISAGSLLSINSWDALVYIPVLIAMGAYLAVTLHASIRAGDPPLHRHPDGISLLLLACSAILVAGPFLLQMSTGSLSGIALVNTPSDPVSFLLAHGWYLLVFFVYVIPDALKRPYLLIPALIPGLLGYWSVSLMAVPILLLVCRQNRTLIDWTAIYGLCILSMTEILYLVEETNPGSRYNTVFKLSLAAWPVLWIAATGMLVTLADRAGFLQAPVLSRESVVLALCGGIVCLALILAPVTPLLPGFSLDGREYLEVYNPDDARMVELLEEDRYATGLVEAAGNYDYYTRVATFSGVPAFIGWPSVEIQWGRNPRAVAERVQAAERIYRDPGATYPLMEQYHLSHLVIGGQELQTYGNISVNPAGFEPQYLGSAGTLLRRVQVVA